jgi:uncharacterized membrane protein YvbJ
MKRCKECGSEVYGSDPICTGCRTSEWLDMHNPKRMQEKRIEIHQKRIDKNIRTMSIIRDVIVTLILVSIGVMIIANLPEALRYEDKKMEILRANGVQ